MNNGFIVSISILILLILTGLTLTAVTSLIFPPILFTPRKILKEIITKIKVSDGDRIIDLGSGDGRILFEISKRKRIEGKGVEISPIMLLISKMVQKFYILSKSKITFEVESYFDTDLSDIDVIYCNLTESELLRLEKKFSNELNRGTYVYSYNFRIGEKKFSNRYKLSNGKYLFEYTY